MGLQERDLVDLAEQYGPDVERLLRRRLGDQLTAEDREDVVAAALCRLWEHRARYEPGSALFGLLYRVAYRAGIDLLRDRHRMPREAAGSAHLRLRQADSSGPDARPGPINEHARLLLDRVRFAMDRLTDADRAARNASLSGDPDWAATAAKQTGESAGALRVRRHRAIQKLRRILLGPNPLD